MAVRYVSNTGSNTSPYDTKAKAATTFANAMTGSSVGDEFRFDHTWSHSVAASIIYDGGAGAGRRLVSWDFTNDLPAAGGAISQSSASWFVWQGNWYVEGMTFTSSSNGISFGNTGNAFQWFHNCKFRLTSGNGSHKIRFGHGDLAGNISQNFKVSKTTFRFSHADQRINVNGRAEMHEVALESGGTSPSYFFDVGAGTSRTALLTCNGLDLSAASSGIDISYNASGNVNGATAWIDNVRVPASWTGTLYGGTSDYAFPDGRIEMSGVDSSDTRYKHYATGWSGKLMPETTRVMTGGAEVDGVSVSWRVDTTSDASHALAAFRCVDLVTWNVDIGSSRTFRIELLHDSATALTDHEVWLELKALTNSGYPNATFATSRPSPATAASNLPSSSATWTTTGMSNPNAQKIEVTVTPQEAGPLVATLWVGKASKTLYVNPALLS